MKTAEELFEQMIVINSVERELLKLFDKGVLRGTVHTCIGQEGVASGVVNALDASRDIVCSNHRGHGHFIAHTGDCAGLIAEIMGRQDGVCRGIGGSQHLHATNFYSNGVLGGMAPVAVGMAFAEKTKGNGSIVAIFLGDGSLGEGVIYEAFNLASLWALPVLFIVEANGYAQSTAICDEQAGNLAERASSFGIASSKVDGNDVLATHELSTQIVAKMRDNSLPHFLYCQTYRLAPHSKGDDTRPIQEIEEAAKYSPIARLRAKMTEASANTIESAVAARIQQMMTSLAV